MSERTKLNLDKAIKLGNKRNPKLNLNREGFCEGAKMTRQTFHRMQTGELSKTYENLFAFLRSIGVNIDEITETEDNGTQ